MSSRRIGGTAARAWATPAVAGAVALSLAGIARLLEPGAWYRTPVVILAATTIAVIATRLVTRRAFLPTGIGALTGGWLLLVAYVRDADGGRSWWPSPAALRTARDMAVTAVDHIYESVPPAPVTPELAALLATAALALLLAADALAVGAGLAATAGVLLVLPWLPPLVLEADIPVPALAGSLALWLLAVALMRRAPATRWRSRAADGPAAGGIVVGATAVSMVIALALVPLATLVPGWGELPRASLPGAWGGPQRLDLAIDLQRSLTARSAEPFLRYSSDSGSIQVLRAYTRVDFDGTDWREETGGETVPASGPLWSEDFPGWQGDQTRTISIMVGDVDNTFVPVPDAPRSLTAPAGWRYDPSRDEVSVEPGAIVAGAQYSAKFATGFHTEETMRAAESAIAAGGDAVLGPRYTALPDALDADRVRELATTVTATAADRYDQAVLIQRHLRSGTFAYTEDVDFDGRDAVSDFLDDRAGYCIHFATTMVMMARTLDIPARLAVGFLGGHNTQGTEYVVTGRDAHAWAEIYFPEHGWVRFDPTPSIQSRAQPEYTVPETDETDVQDNLSNTARPDATPSTASTAPSPTSTSGTDAGASGAEAEPWGWTVAVAALVLTLAALGVAAVRLRSRSRRLDPEQAWAAARRAIGGPLAAPAITPAEARAAQADELAGWDDQERSAWESLTRAVEDHRYAPGGSSAGPDELAAWVASVRAAARRSARAERPPRR